MIQTGLIQSAHNDLVTDTAYDFYGLRLATSGLDQRIKIWQLDEGNGTWGIEDDWKAHDAAVAKIDWAHPEFGSIIVSCSFDRTVKIWEQTSLGVGVQTESQQQNGVNGTQNQNPSRWIERAVLADARGSVRSVEFAPRHFGLKIATISSDNHLRVYECLEQPSLTSWHLSEEVDILSLPSSVSSSQRNARAQTHALATPTQTSSTLDPNFVTHGSLVAQALHQGLQQGIGRAPTGNREADGGWSISWCKDRYWGEIIAAGCGTSGEVKIVQLSPSRRPATLLTLEHSPSTKQTTSTETPNPSHSNQQTAPSRPASNGTSATASTSAGGPVSMGSGLDTDLPPQTTVSTISWAPSCGRSYHLIATGGRDGHVRIWRVKPAAEERENENDAEVEDGGNFGSAGDNGGSVGEGESEENKWSAAVVADFDHHKSAVGRVEWNITGTVLSSAGNDGKIRLWKATSGNVWRPAGSISVEQAEEVDKADGRDEDVDMEKN